LNESWEFLDTRSSYSKWLKIFGPILVLGLVALQVASNCEVSEARRNAAASVRRLYRQLSLDGANNPILHLDSEPRSGLIDAERKWGKPILRRFTVGPIQLSGAPAEVDAFTTRNGRQYREHLILHHKWISNVIVHEGTD
jgi:hypothetical protein